MQAVLINPLWSTTTKTSSKVPGSVTIEDFAQLQFSKKLMIDTLVFVWVEKEIISPVIKILEKQNLVYVENVCWVMLDETKQRGMIPLL